MLYVLTGGARSGKSSAAEALAERTALPVTVVAAGAAAGDEEMARRIEAHRAGRPSGWRTEEIAIATAWRAERRPGRCAVLECLGTLTARIMDEAASDAGLLDPWEAAELPASLARDVEMRLGDVVTSCVRAAARQPDSHLIVVTNEVGDGVVPEYPSGRLFRDALGRADRTLVDAADAAWLVVAGRCIDLAILPSVPDPSTTKES